MLVYQRVSPEISVDFQRGKALELRQGRRSNASTGSTAMDHSVAQKAAGGAVGNMAWFSCRNWCFDAEK